ncbi:indolepyruvate ferredoxin oxidoreductase subunit alpha [Coprobacter tertius]|uniref:Indolepyruvate oxidoreductase subunit IorA n=1 Tax=Coprobacter tertius TaxID=2944915 RepID=A0ABT1MKG2_9BACT|nr:indolepyruvate ferredoxin oxidoreductase subunit alpha [Coprobacter tertius]MCP9611721.1 indolepyruvate ferredoxin oxidoreductase subunit alpha [Coprobacter tertius]
MNKHLLLGDEAIAQAALDAGISGVYAYPGTPSTEITEYIQAATQKTGENIHSRWSANEKTAMEAALGMSYIGKRALVCMKHVGMNVAADAFVNAGMTGVNGGLIIVAADDPSMHSSQNEQDSRFYGDFAFVPILEPSNQQEAYDMVISGFELSEQFKIPVILRITTRLAHSRSGVDIREKRYQNKISFPDDPKQFILLPANSRKRFKILLQDQKKFVQAAEKSEFNHYIDGNNKKLGIIACGIAYNYLTENFPDGCEYPIIKISQYPLPVDMIARLVKECNEILILEEGYAFVEEKLKGLLGLGITVKGRLDGTLDRDGELNPDKVATALGLKNGPTYPIPDIVMMRPPALCQGCGHRDMYEALNNVARTYENARIFSDIGCYTLGALPPFRAIHSCVDMGASVTMAKGAADGGLFPAIAVIGDSTFTHSGITGLLDCVNENANVTIIISDNETTAMTGGQDSAGTGKLEAICAGVGVSPEHIRIVEPLKKNMQQMETVIREEIEYKGVSVIIPRRECIQTLSRKKRQKA